MQFGDDKLQTPTPSPISEDHLTNSLQRLLYTLPPVSLGPEGVIVSKLVPERVLCRLGHGTRQTVIIYTISAPLTYEHRGGPCTMPSPGRDHNTAQPLGRSVKQDLTAFSAHEGKQRSITAPTCTEDNSG